MRYSPPRWSWQIIMAILSVNLCIAMPESDATEAISLVNANMAICTTPDQINEVNGPLAFFQNIFSTSNYPARWNCGYWSDFEGWFTIISDLSIFSAYMSIPVFLMFLFIQKRYQNRTFNKFLLLFSAFIVLCGFTHLIEAIIFWEPVYRLSSLMKFLTGAVSWVTVIAISKALPVALTYKSPAALQKEVNRRKEAQKKFDYFIQYTPGAVAMFDLDMTYLVASKRWMEDYNLVGQEITGKSHYEVFPEIREDWKQIHQECLAGAINKNEGVRFEREDGSVQWITWEVRPWNDENDEIGGIMMLTENITERMEAKEKLRLSEETFRRAFEHSAIGMAMVGLKGEWIKVNLSLCKILGYSEEELLKQTFQDITHPADLEADLELVTELIEGKRSSYHLEKRYFHKDGHIIWAILAVSMVADTEGKPVHFISQITDITMRREAEHRLEKNNRILSLKNKELEQFTYIASHDLREPLNTITGFSNILIEKYGEQKDQTFKMMLDQINDSTDRMNVLVKELLNYSRLNEPVIPGKINMNELLDETIQDLKSAIDSTKTVINTEELAPTSGDRTKIRLLLQNLISNAIKFSSKDRNPEIHVGQNIQQGQVVYYVKDNGIGIDPKYKEKIFNMFQRLHHREDYDGSGIGLASCKKIVGMHEGDLWVESKLDEGSTFYFTLNEQGYFG